MFGPKNKILDDNFLRTFIEHLEKEDYRVEKLPIKILYNDEDFYITKIDITDKPIKITNKTYHDAWKFCNTSKPLPDVCPCMNSDEETNNEENNKSPGNRLELIDLKNVMIKYNGDNISYFSQPAKHYLICGAQYQWIMIFNYSQPDLNICLEMGPKRYINDTKLIGCACIHSSDTPIYQTDVNKLVYIYEPNNLFFDNSFFMILKKCLEKNSNKIQYKEQQYKLIDYKFCKVECAFFSCGCHHFSCSNVNKAKFISICPANCSYTLSCTPEWYLQVQIGACPAYNGYCFRFILEPIIFQNL